MTGTAMWVTHNTGHKVQQQAGMIAGHSKPAFNKAARVEDSDARIIRGSDWCTIVRAGGVDAVPQCRTGVALQRRASTGWRRRGPASAQHRVCAELPASR